MKIRVLVVGKGMPPPIRALVEDYLKRIQAFCEIELLEVAAEKSGGRERVLLREGERLAERIPNGALVMPLDRGGKPCSSPELAHHLGRMREEGTRELCFLIGGSEGLTDALSRRGPALSFGPMTFPHMLFRVMLLEQIYRAFTIQKGVPYHK